MKDDNLIKDCFEVAKRAASNTSSYEQRLAIYENLKHKLQGQFIFGKEKELSDILRI